MIPFGPGRPAKAPPPPPPARKPLPSDKLKPSLSSPFASASRSATPFGAAYAGGSVPVRIQHGSVRATLLWTTPVAELLSDGGEAFTALLLLVAEGLREKLHPLSFIARSAWAALLSEPGAARLVAAVLPLLTAPLRAALSSDESAVCAAACVAVAQLAECLGSALLVELTALLVPLRRLLSTAEAREALSVINRCCGPAAYPLLRSKLPGWQG